MTTTPRLNLLVLRVVDIDRAAAFYGRLGFIFTRHAHGSGPEHYACEIDELVFELYPASVDHPISASVRIGFTVADVDIAAAALGDAGGGSGVGTEKFPVGPAGDYC